MREGCMLLRKEVRLKSYWLRPGLNRRQGLTDWQKEHCLPVECWLRVKEFHFSCVLVACGRVTFQLRVGCVRKSSVLVASWLSAEELHASWELFACGRVAYCLRLGCVQEICKLCACGRAVCYSRVGCVREICELFACGTFARKLRVGYVLVTCRLRLSC